MHHAPPDVSVDCESIHKVDCESNHNVLGCRREGGYFYPHIPHFCPVIGRGPGAYQTGVGGAIEPHRRGVIGPRERPRWGEWYLTHFLT
jgi:hypothetical protein